MLLPPPPKNNTVSLTKHNFALNKISADSLIEDEIKVNGETIITKLTGKRKVQLIKYLKTHKPIGTNSIIPLRANCGDHFTYYWQPEGKFRSKPGKYLGIWADQLDWEKLHDKYGFTNIITTFSNVSRALNAHFKHDSIMINLGGVDPEEIFNNPAFNYYYIDEPYENGPILGTVILTYSQNINSVNADGKLLFSDWYWPENNLLCFTRSNNGSYINNNYFPNPNVYLMCDQYTGNGCGNAENYWNEYKNYYGMPSRNLTDWLSINPNYTPSDQWVHLLNLAMQWTSSGAMNPLWIYASYSSVSESDIADFCNIYAWPTGWIEQESREYEVYWKCDNINPCVTCDWNNQSDWYIYAVYPLGEQWF